MYYQRPDVDGKDVQKISKAKRIISKLFKQSAGTSYFVIKPGTKRSRIMIKSPTLKLGRNIRSAVGQTVWKDTNAVSSQPAIAYNLSVFKDPNFSLSIQLDNYDINKITLAELCVRALSGTAINLKTDGREKDADALDDFRAISKGARVLIENSTVEYVLIKFLAKKDRRRVLAKARIYPNRIELEEENWDLINTHLRAWRITSE